jgi:hypothetical protein
MFFNGASYFDIIMLRANDNAYFIKRFLLASRLIFDERRNLASHFDKRRNLAGHFDERRNLAGHFDERRNLSVVSEPRREISPCHYLGCIDAED